MANNTLTAADVRHIAKLANLPLTEAEISQYQQQLSSILQYVNKLQEINTDDVAITSQVTGTINVYKAGDLVDELRMLSQQQALQNVPQTQNGYVVVPAVIEKE